MRLLVWTATAFQRDDFIPSPGLSAQQGVPMATAGRDSELALNPDRCSIRLHRTVAALLLHVYG